MTLSKRSLQFIFVLSSCSTVCEGFISPKNQRSTLVPLHRVRTRTQLRVAAAHDVHTDVNSLNDHLEKLANQCGDFHNPVVTLASQAERMFTDCNARDTKSLNCLLRAWSRVCQVMADHRSDLPQMSAQNLPTVPIYKTRDAAEHMTKLLMDAEHEFEEHPDETTTVPDRDSYNLVIEGWARSEVEEATEAAERLFRKLLESKRLGTDTASYHGVLDAWSHSSNPGAFNRMLKIFNNMKEASKENPLVQPNIRTLNFIILSCARRANTLDHEDALDTAREAHQLLKDQLEENDQRMLPDLTSYTAVVDAYSNTESLEGAKLAESVVRDLEATYETTKDNRLRPNLLLYTALMKAWAHAKDEKGLLRVEEIFNEIESSEFLRPNTRSYAILLNSLSRSWRQDKARKALKILMSMREKAKNGERDIKPPLYIYNCAIEICAKTQGDLETQMEALKIAFAILRSIEADPDLEPNDATHAYLIRAAGQLLPQGKERNDIMVKVFHKAKKAGLVSHDVLKYFRKNAYNEIVRQELGCMEDSKGFINFSETPQSWNKNVK